MILALMTMACSISFNVPRTAPGELQVFSIDEKASTNNQTMEVEIQVGAAQLTIGDGASGLLEGEIRYNNPDWEPKVDRSSDSIVITQPLMEDMNYLPRGDSRNEWDLKVGSDPISLTIKAGAYEGEMEFSDYSFTNFSVNDGAAESKVLFDAPNKVEMRQFVYHTGASKVDLIGLANANFEEMSFDSGAGSYTLDFSGEFKRDAHVTVKSGVSNVEIFIPEGMNSQVTINGGLNNVDLEGTWTSSNNTYSTSGEGPALTIDIDMGVGNVRLVSE